MADHQTPTLSPDRQWLWDGYGWVPTLSPDGQWAWDGYRWNPVPPMLHRWRWDGERWVPRLTLTARMRRLPKWLIWSWVVWLPFLVAWIPTVMTVVSHHDSRGLVTIVAASIGGLAVVATIAFGGSLGYRRSWGYLGWSLLLGMAVIGLFIFFAFDASQPANAPDDPGLGLGAMLVTAALSPVVALLLWFGGGVGILIRRFRK